MDRKRRPYKKFLIKIKNKNYLESIFQMYSPQEKLQGCIWDFTLGDPDDHPSVPHAHSRVEGYRLDVWTGDIYPAGKERKDTIGKLKKKELRRLHTDPKFKDFTKKQIKWYKEQYPDITFYVPAEFELRHMQRNTLWIGKNEEIKKFTFIGTAVISKRRWTR